MAGYIDGKFPAQVTTLQASVSVETPYIQQASGAHTLAVPDPAGNDTLTVLSGAQTLSSKTLLNPVITSGVLTQPIITSGVLTQPVITSGVLTSPLITTADIRLTGGGTLTGGIMHNVIGGIKVAQTQAVGATKTLDLSTADIFIVNLTQACTLTVSNAGSSKQYTVVVKQGVANSYFGMSWMSGFVNPSVASGPTQRTGAIDIWQVTFDQPVGLHYAIGAKDIQT